MSQSSKNSKVKSSTKASPIRKRYIFQETPEFFRGDELCKFFFTHGGYKHYVTSLKVSGTNEYVISVKCDVDFSFADFKLLGTSHPLEAIKQRIITLYDLSAIQSLLCEMFDDETIDEDDLNGLSQSVFKYYEAHIK